MQKKRLCFERGCGIQMAFAGWVLVCPSKRGVVGGFDGDGQFESIERVGGARPLYSKIMSQSDVRRK